ncbi:unnamed protein product [Caenorhabditis bovis]|uniref:Glucosylceramidase n=1 Tax=Caenorhabditis bovis TaxID=2654633 RepID=A0A8S1F879_9PELO|nr:unnamed protein product [Caenorhabditis bovis]
MRIYTLFVLFLIVTVTCSFSPCVLREEAHGPICVCNATYCDTIEPLGTVVSGKSVVYTSSKTGKRLKRSEHEAKKTTHAKVKLTFNASEQFQTIMGFGGAFTDAVGINLENIGSNMADQIINQYYGEEGLGYVYGRVPMASCDFSVREYSYDDTDLDFELTNFKLADEDVKYKIPYIKKARAASKNALKLFATPWSAPGWMKTNGRMIGGGKLLGDQNGKYYNTWANYFVKFFEEYHKLGIDFWATTVQNEPTSGLDPNYKWQTMYFSASMERNFIKKLLGPALQANAVTGNLTIMINDDQRYNLPHWPDTILNDPMAAKYVSGIALHWYEDFIEPATVLTTTHNRHPDYFLMATEACAGYIGSTGPELGKWSRAEEYANSLIRDISNWVTGFVDWNLVLDMIGGPNLVKNYVDAAIIINKDKQEYYKQPIWHVMAHFSKFVKPGAIRIGTYIAEKINDIEGVAFLNKDGTKTVVILNRDPVLPHSISISDVSVPDQFYTLELDANSIVTIILK